MELLYQLGLFICVLALANALTLGSTYLDR